MANTKNALAELAERLMHHLEVANAVAGFNQQVWGDIRKAQRIVAELAKHNISLIPQDCYGCGVLKTLANCRAIAEEGADDGNR